MEKRNSLSEVLVVGSAALTRVHLPDGARVETAGGAGLYAALASARAGADTTLLGVRAEPLPAALSGVGAMVPWVGPVGVLPRLEIAHYGGGKAALLGADWGAEGRLVPDLLDDFDFGAMGWAVAMPMADPARQLAFVQAFRARGWRSAAVTYGRAASGQRGVVLDTVTAADYFFCNENEANLLFGGVAGVVARAGQVVVVTLGAGGAWVIEAERRTHIAAPVVAEVDPTGAGDTLCGTLLARLAQGDDLLAAALAGVVAASASVRVVGAFGV